MNATREELLVSGIDSCNRRVTVSRLIAFSYLQTAKPINNLSSPVDPSVRGVRDLRKSSP